MKRLAIATILFLASFAQAEEKMDLLCMTEFPSTSFVVRDIEDTTVLEVFHHNGTKYMPIFDGVATPNDVAILSEKAQILSSLGEYMRFEWPRDKCKKQEDLVSQCAGSTEVQEIEGHKVKAWHFDSELVMEKTSVGKFNSYKLTLNLDVDGKSLSIPMKYNERECTDQMTMRASLPAAKSKH
ncbi:hypothetical protein [Bdellovibrio svalbardensis]|uniref:Uncharacterized protein n=1 Tax=Bdellovibrio svalbardensis TaxID=2972972 RepID=A0ABT6DG91_9BACT|nr:hypothetical protein [Bdellovibrio svalbardensis]MDG0815873.1 hypothetical protein [Bdellovibrio svalbardensis]